MKTKRIFGPADQGRNLKLIPAILLSHFILCNSISSQPVVNRDYSVTFKANVPWADSVKLEGDIIMELTGVYNFDSIVGIPFKKDSNGIWEVTIGPLKPGPYLYNLNINGKSVIDPANSRIFFGQKYRKNILQINTTDGSALWENSSGRSGTIHRHLFNSTISGTPAELYVYTPPGYEQSNKRYPVLYLLHGRGEKADSWLTAGYLSQIADNLLEEGRMRQTVIVMPFGWVVTPGTPDSKIAESLNHNLEEEMFTSIIPLIEHSYKVFTNRFNRAIAGFSMGGAQAGYIGLKNTSTFSYIGVFSAGLYGFEDDFKDIFKDPPGLNRRLKYFFFGAGKKDNIGPGGSSIEGQKNLDRLLSKEGINHVFFEMPDAGHTWKTWRFLLSEKFLPYLWID